MKNEKITSDELIESINIIEGIIVKIQQEHDLVLLKNGSKHIHALGEKAKVLAIDDIIELSKSLEEIINISTGDSFITPDALIYLIRQCLELIRYIIVSDQKTEKLNIIKELLLEKMATIKRSSTYDTRDVKIRKGL